MELALKVEVLLGYVNREVVRISLEKVWQFFCFILIKAR